MYENWEVARLKTASQQNMITNISQETLPGSYAIAIISMTPNYKPIRLIGVKYCISTEARYDLTTNHPQRSGGVSKNRSPTVETRRLLYLRSSG